MAVENKLHRCAEDDPNRCQSVFKLGQCPYLSTEGSTYCHMHGGAKTAQAAQVKVIRQYNLAQWQARTEHFADNDQVKSLRDEIGIARMLLENMLTQCRDTNDLLMYSAKIGDLVTKIEKLVVSCNRLESSMGLLLDKAAALQLAGQMVEIISRHIDDPEAIDGIAGEIASAISNLNGSETPP